MDRSSSEYRLEPLVGTEHAQERSDLMEAGTRYAGFRDQRATSTSLVHDIQTQTKRIAKSQARKVSK